VLIVRLFEEGSENAINSGKIETHLRGVGCDDRVSGLLLRLWSLQVFALLRMVSMKTSFIRICLSLSTLVLWSTSLSSTGLGQLTGSGSGSSLSGSASSIFSGSSIASGSTIGSSSTSSTSGGSGTSGSTARTGGNTATSTAGTPAQTFIGSNASEAFVGGARTATGQQSTNRQFQAFQNDQTASNGQSQPTGTPRQIRTALAISFNYPTASTAQQTGRLADANSLSLAQFSATRPELSGINVSLTSQGTAVLTGTLPTADSSRLAANLIRLQPGVRKVENQIAVTP